MGTGKCILLYNSQNRREPKVNLGNRPVEILLVEDNEGDIRLTQEAFRDSQVGNHLNVVRDGVEAIAFLKREEKYANAVRPDIILLDLNLPKRNGIEVLAEIKQDDQLKRIPVIVLTSSQAEPDILSSYDLHANCFISKPIDLDRFLRVVQSIEDFWLTIVKLPPE
ncbi:response regulator [Coleofasciculus sp. FACHB-64]|nr:response regulator [Coleofasciculus sp. FACHB-501]MBD1880059.1 response regulator [Coleofasciculus sp. FACHB-T130]MBD1902505.1 response regulator [Coleofasciculus sp. FACHB-125]MBD2047496.1 response regulator [Coleofasciculus sp. FACHB-64]MBD2085273.1 response regulator [Coleofasciculus sp. FACHB-542]